MLQGEGQIVLDDGDFEAAVASAATTIKRQYRVPFVSHSPMEPQNCFAHVKEDSCQIIVPTQTPSGASRAAAAVTGLSREKIHVDMTRVGGAFGRRLTNDYVTEAALISKHTGWPIKLLWSREDELKNDFYRPGGLHEMQAGLDTNGKVTAWLSRPKSIGETYPVGGPDVYTWPQFYQACKPHLPKARNKKIMAIPVWYANLIAATSPSVALSTRATSTLAIAGTT